MGRELTWEVWAPEGHMMTSGSAEQIREEIEEKLQDTLGFFVMLEIDDEDTNENDKPVCRLYPHTDNDDDLTGEEIVRLTGLGVDIRGSIEANHEAICNILGITVTR